MSCDDGLCGVGTYTGPKPGDPDNDVTLRARQVYGGINVTWSFPLINSHAVAHTLLYRGTTNVLDNAILFAHVGGSVFFDRLDPEVETTYFYWIKIVSINGTTGEPVGPVSATARPQVEQTLESLTGLIDAGKLAQDLKTSISGLTSTDSDLYAKFLDLKMGDLTYRQALLDVQNGLQQAMTFVAAETTQRIDGDNATVEQLQLLAVANQNAIAAIADDTSVAVTQNSALAQRITTAEASLNGDVATGQIGLITKVGSFDGKLNELSAEYFVKLEVDGLIGGFGLLNDGILVEAGFDVDRFWIGRTNADKVKPFIIDNGIVYIDKAKIREADIDTLKIAGNAVTVPISAYTAGPVQINGRNVNNGLTTIQSITMNSSNAPVVLTFGAHVGFGSVVGGYDSENGNPINAASAPTIRIYRDETVIYEDIPAATMVGGDSWPSAIIFYQIQDRPPAGTRTYSFRVLSAADNLSGGEAKKIILNLFEAKR